MVSNSFAVLVSFYADLHKDSLVRSLCEQLKDRLLEVGAEELEDSYEVVRNQMTHAGRHKGPPQST